MKKQILFICGSINQTTQMHQIAQELPEYGHCFSPYYCDGFLERLRRRNMVEYTILGNKMVNRCLSYLKAHDLPVDYQGANNFYDLVLTCADLIIPGNILDKKIMLIQEGMTDPENWLSALVKRYRVLPRWLASTSANGTSDLFDVFCVASEGYREHFIRKGVQPEKIVITGIPNFDNCRRFLENDFPHRHFVLVCTSDSRETFRYENRKKFIRDCTAIANGRPLLFKLHPNENIERATWEINTYAPGALVFATGDTNAMIANSDALITQYSSTVYVAMALDKEVHSYFDIEELRRLLPIQNGRAAKNIADVCRSMLEGAPVAKSAVGS